jgi:hypothetical protein
VWLHVAWSSIPPTDVNYTRIGRISGFSAIGRLFIPFYCIVWAFEVHSILCEAINDSLVRRRMPTRAYAAPAMLATVGQAAMLVIVRLRGSRVHIDPGVVMMLLLATHALWFAYILYTDAARRIMMLAYLAEQEAGPKREEERVPAWVRGETPRQGS